MDSSYTEADGGIFGLRPYTMAILIIVVFFALWTAYTWYYGGVTVPLPSYKTGFVGSQEGFLGGRFTQYGRPIVDKDKKPTTVSGFFGGVSKGAGVPDCLRSSSEGSRLLGLFEGREDSGSSASCTGVANGDLAELTELVGKLLCFKKDLVSPSYTVNATRQQRYVTSHDVEPIAETTGRCFAKTLGPRDLGLAFDKWTSRGEFLIQKLCTAAKLAPKEVDTAQELFRFVIRDVRDIANGTCLEGEPKIAGKPGPRDAHPFESSAYDVIGKYDGYY
jgi:hypothetical protein